MSRVESNWAALQVVGKTDPFVAEAVEELSPEQALEITEYAEENGIPSWREAYEQLKGE